MSTNTGMPLPTDIKTLFDGFAGWLLREFSGHGIGADSESGAHTLAWQASNARNSVFGDNATPGISSEPLKAALASEFDTWFTGSRFDVCAASALRGMIAKIESQVTSSLPSYTDPVSGITRQWSFSSSGVRAIDALVQRFNGMSANAPPAPVAAPTLAATVGGAIPAIAAGSGRRVVYTNIGKYDHWESYPSAEATQVALTGVNNAYTVANFPVTVPAGVYGYRLYSGLEGGAGGVYGFVKQCAVTPGTPSPASFLFTEPESAIRTEITPPGFAKCLLGPEAALCYMLIYAQLSRKAAAQRGPMTPGSGGLFDPSGIALGPVSGILGYANPDTSGKLADWLSTVFSAGAVRLANEYVNGSQGFIGAANGVQARTASVLNANATITNVTIKYLNAANPYILQTTTLAGPFVLNAAAGSTVDLAVTAGWIVQQITAAAVAGAATGNIVFEAETLRAL